MQFEINVLCEFVMTKLWLNASNHKLILTLNTFPMGPVYHFSIKVVSTMLCLVSDCEKNINHLSGFFFFFLGGGGYKIMSTTEC